MIQSIRFEHLAIPVKKLEESIHFYERILGLNQLERPNFDFRGAWFDLGFGIQLHLMEQPDFELISGTKLTHFAFTVDNVRDIETLCLTHKIDFKPIKFRSDGIRQIFIIDPNGWYVEFNSK